MENEICHIKLEDIVPNKYQPREIINDESLNELADSIKQHGVIQPIIVRNVMGKYEIVDGFRRYRAAIMAGLNKIPALVRSYDDKESVRISLIDNLQRKDLSPIEEARAYKYLLELENMTQDDLANTLGKSQSAVANKIRLLNLPIEVQEALLNGKISERHARSLLTMKDVDKQIALLNEIIEKRMSVRELDSEIKNMNKFIPDNINSVNNQNDVNSSNMFIPNNYPDNQSSGMENKFIPSNNGPLNQVNNTQNENVLQGNMFMPTNQFVNQTGIMENSNMSNPFITNNNYAAPMSMQNDTPGFNPFSNIKQEPIESNNQTNQFIPSNNQNETYSDGLDFTKLSGEEDNKAFNINDYKMPYTEEVPTNNTYHYVEENPNYNDIESPKMISSIDEVIALLKSTIEQIKNSKLKVDTEEIDFDDMYQITIKIDKKGNF